MQNRYVGDIGDYLKLAILRALMPGSKLGVAWWLHPDERHNGDGRHIRYLEDSTKWKTFDPELFSILSGIVCREDRNVAALQTANLLPEAVFFDEFIPVEGPSLKRALDRCAWFQRVADKLNGCDLLFFDPDNGLETKNFNHGARKAGKSISLAELGSLRMNGRTLIVYHHQTRMRGGHHHELIHWGQRLREAGFQGVDALRASPYSARAFFLLDAPDEIRGRAERLAHRWGKHLTWHPALG
jgi:hypothetical protein